MEIALSLEELQGERYQLEGFYQKKNFLWARN